MSADKRFAARLKAALRKLSAALALILLVCLTACFYTGDSRNERPQGGLEGSAESEKDAAQSRDGGPGRVTLPSLPLKSEASTSESSSASASAEEDEEPSEREGTGELSGLDGIFTEASQNVVYGEAYSSAEEVAEYLKYYAELPPNYLTKKEARALGWIAKEGNLWDVAPGMSIGGDRFGNREGSLPEKKGRRYYECDINYQGGRRGPERLVYSDDGLIFYTADHYRSFQKLYD